MESLRLRASETAYHLERLSNSKAAWRAVEKRDKESFRKVCKRLHISEKYVDSLVKIVFSSDPEPTTWPWN